MTEELSGNLGQIQNLRVPGRLSVMRYKGTKKTLAEIATELRVESVVKGSVLGSGGKVRIAVSLIRMKEAGEGQTLWQRNYERAAEDVLILQNEIARDIVREVRIQLSPREQQRLARTDKVDPEAHKLYVTGRQLWNKGDLPGYLKALSYFRAAQLLAPTYAAPYAGLADTYLALAASGVLESGGANEEARKQAMRAVDLDSELEDPYVSLATIALHDWDWAKAEDLYSRAIVLNPNYAHGHTTTNRT